MVVSCMEGLAGYTGSKHLCLPNVLYMTLTKKIVSQVRLWPARLLRKKQHQPQDPIVSQATPFAERGRVWLQPSSCHHDRNLM